MNMYYDLRGGINRIQRSSSIASKRVNAFENNHNQNNFNHKQTNIKNYQYNNQNYLNNYNNQQRNSQRVGNINIINNRNIENPIRFPMQNEVMKILNEKDLNQNNFNNRRNNLVNHNDRRYNQNKVSNRPNIGNVETKEARNRSVIHSLKMEEIFDGQADALIQNMENNEKLKKQLNETKKLNDTLNEKIQNLQKENQDLRRKINILENYKTESELKNQTIRDLQEEIKSLKSEIEKLKLKNEEKDNQRLRNNQNNSIKEPLKDNKNESNNLLSTNNYLNQYSSFNNYLNEYLSNNNYLNQRLYNNRGNRTLIEVDEEKTKIENQFINLLTKNDTIEEKYNKEYESFQLIQFLRNETQENINQLKELEQVDSELFKYFDEATYVEFDSIKEMIIKIENDINKVEKEIKKNLENTQKNLYKTFEEINQKKFYYYNDNGLNNLLKSANNILNDFQIHSNNFNDTVDNIVNNQKDIQEVLIKVKTKIEKFLNFAIEKTNKNKELQSSGKKQNLLANRILTHSKLFDLKDSKSFYEKDLCEYYNKINKNNDKNSEEKKYDFSELENRKNNDKNSFNNEFNNDIFNYNRNKNSENNNTDLNNINSLYSKLNNENQFNNNIDNYNKNSLFENNDLYSFNSHENKKSIDSNNNNSNMNKLNDIPETSSNNNTKLNKNLPKKSNSITSNALNNKINSAPNNNNILNKNVTIKPTKQIEEEEEEINSELMKKKQRENKQITNENENENEEEEEEEFFQPELLKNNWEQTTILTEDGGQEVEIKCILKAVGLKPDSSYTKWYYTFDIYSDIQILFSKINDIPEKNPLVEDHLLTFYFKLKNNEELPIHFKYKSIRKDRSLFYNQLYVGLNSLLAERNAKFTLICPEQLTIIKFKQKLFTEVEKDKKWFFEGKVPDEGLITKIAVSLTKAKWKLTLTEKFIADNDIKNTTFSTSVLFEGGNNKILSNEIESSMGNKIDNDTIKKINDKYEITFKNLNVKECYFSNIITLENSTKSNYKISKNIEIKTPEDEIKNKEKFLATINHIFQVDKSNDEKHIKISKYVKKIMKYKLSYSGKILTASEILEKKEGVCEHYTILLNALLNCIGIPALYVTGYCINEVKDGRDGTHVWSLCKINNKWIPIDPTWGIFDGKLPISHIFGKIGFKGIQIRSFDNVVMQPNSFQYQFLGNE